MHTLDKNESLNSGANDTDWSDSSNWDTWDADRGLGN